MPCSAAGAPSTGSPSARTASAQSPPPHWCSPHSTAEPGEKTSFYETVKVVINRGSGTREDISGGILRTRGPSSSERHFGKRNGGNSAGPERKNTRVRSTGRYTRQP